MIYLRTWGLVLFSFFTNLIVPLGQTYLAQFSKMLQSQNSPANHLNTCLTLSESLSLRHSNHSCVIYSWPSGEQKECNVANPQPIRRQNRSDRWRCWKIFAWLWTCVWAGKGSEDFLNSVGVPHDFFFLLFLWALAHSQVPKPQVLLLSACMVAACSMQASGLLWGKNWDGSSVCKTAMAVKGQLSNRCPFQSSVHLWF